MIASMHTPGRVFGLQKTGAHGPGFFVAHLRERR